MMPTRTSLKKNLMAACSIGVMAVAITGCSSSDKDSVSPALQRQVTAAQGAQAAALAAQADAEKERDAAQAALTGAEGERDAAQVALTGAEGERDAAQAALTGVEGARDAAQAALAGAVAAVIAGLEAAGVTLSPEAMAGDVTALGAAIAGAGMDLATANADLATANADLATANADLATANADLATANADLVIANADLATANADLATANAELVTLRASVTTSPGLQQVADMFATAQIAIEDAKTAAAAAEAALEAATEDNDGYATLEVAGDSATAMANAQAVLDALGDADAAVTMANAAVASAEAALEDAEALDGDTVHRDELVLALKAAVAAAEESAEAAAKSRGDDKGALELAVADVEGDDEDEPMTAADHAEAVAMDIAMALLPATAADGGGARVTHGVAEPTDDAADDAVMMNDHQGKTWAEIVGASNIVDKRIAANGATKAVKAASIAGMAAADVDSALTIGEHEDGVQFLAEADANTDGLGYSGIPGTVFCGGSDCEVDEDGDLVGSWYFTPTDGDEWYVGNTDDDGVTTYAVELMYARFGHWLTADGENTRVNTYALKGKDGTNTDMLDVETVNTGEDATELTDSSATYSGTAAGMSIEKTTDADGNITDIQSGAFTATVGLKATFGSSPTIGGTVTNFDGPAADPNWSVELQVTEFTGAAIATGTPGRTIATGRDGEWTAQGYGVAEERPTGVFGGFNAHFSDGHAAGAYTTRD